MNPLARKDQVLAQEVGDEVVVYDERTNEAHRLNPTAAMVWRLADGERSVDDMATLVRDGFDTAESEELVQLALAELERTNLLQPGLRAFHIGDIMSRRQMFKAAAALLPVVASIVAPTPAMAQASVYNCPPNCLLPSLSSAVIPSSSSASPSSSSTSSSSSSSTSSSSSSSSSTSSSSSSSNSSSSSSGPNFTSFNGNYSGSGKASTNTCGFAAAPAMTGVLTLDSNGRGTWTKRHVAANQTFAFTGVQASQNGNNPNSIRFTVSRTFNLGSSLGTYTVTDTITITGNNLTGTQRFVSNTGCEVLYALTMSK